MIGLKQWITKVSGKLARNIYTADYVQNSVVESNWTSARQIRRVGDLAFFSFNGRLTGNLPAGTETTIAKINNEAYRPYNNSIYLNIPTQDNKGAILLSIKTTGEITIYAASAITIGSTTFARAQIAYVCRGGVISYSLHLTELPKSSGRRWAHADPQGFADEDAGKYKNVAVKHFHPSNKSFRPRNKGFHLGDECNYSVIRTDKNRQQCFFGDINSEYFRSIRSYQLQRGIEHTHGIQTCRSNSEADVKLRSLLLQLFHGFKHSSNCSADEGRWERFIDNPERISDLCKGITVIPREGVAA